MLVYVVNCFKIVGDYFFKFVFVYLCLIMFACGFVGLFMLVWVVCLTVMPAWFVGFYVFTGCLVYCCDTGLVLLFVVVSNCFRTKVDDRILLTVFLAGFKVEFVVVVNLFVASVCWLLVGFVVVWFRLVLLIGVIYLCCDLFGWLTSCFVTLWIYGCGLVVLVALLFKLMLFCEMFAGLIVLLVVRYIAC